MYVEVNGCRSRTRTLNIGLPQGSVSSPWLFSLYINDMHRTSDKLNFIHFADDTTIYRSGRDLKTLCDEVCQELCVVDDWLKANRLSLNIDKTNYMIITHNPFDEHDVTIKIRDRPLTRVTSTKFLGITIDDRLSYGGHLSALCRQLSRTKGILYKLSSFIPPLIIANLYYALFHSRMVYGVSVWGGSGITNINRIRNVHESAIKIFNNRIPPHVRRPLSFDSTYALSSLVGFHRFACAGGMEHFNVKISHLIPSHSHDTRHVLNNRYLIPSYNKTVSQNQFLYNCVVRWNALPSSLTSITCTETFKRKLKHHLYNNQ